MTAAPLITPAQRAEDARDPLTGLTSEFRSRATLAEWQAEGADNVQAMLVALGELDALNTAFGRVIGDAVLCETARRITSFAEDEFAGSVSLRGRIGGSSFLVAVREECSRERWHLLAEALADTLALPYRSGADTPGIRLWPRLILARGGAAEAPAALLDKLAEGLMQPRSGSSRRIEWIGGKPGRFGSGRRKLENDLLSAIDRNEIAIVYQPQYACQDGRLIGAEALARWDHPEAGQLGASALFTLAERTDHVAQLSRHVIGRALAEAAAWPDTLRLSVNATAIDLSAASFGPELIRLAKAARFPLDRLTLEITEQSRLGDIAKAQAILAELSSCGVSIALDDFGAGFCNFRYLKLLPLSVLKLDRAMIDGICDDQRDLAVFRGILAMARALDLKIVVEGVESEAQRQIVTVEGCTYYQGFLASAPLSRADFVKLAAHSA